MSDRRESHSAYSNDWILFPPTPEQSHYSWDPSRSTPSSADVMTSTLPKTITFPRKTRWDSSAASKPNELLTNGDIRIGDTSAEFFAQRSYVPPSRRTADCWRPSPSREERDSGPWRNSTASNDSDHHRDIRLPEPEPTKCPSETSPSKAQKILPKHFNKPLTCFYWATQGHCNKSDNECWYAHHWTGVVAAAPVRIGQGSAVAGKVAERVVDEATSRVRSVEAQEAVLIARERDIAINEEAIERSAANLKRNIGLIFDELSHINKATLVTSNVLQQCRKDTIGHFEQQAHEVRLTGYIDNSRDGYQTLSRARGDVGLRTLSTIETALGALSSLKSELAEIEKHMNNTVGGYEGEMDEGGVGVHDDSKE